MFDTDDRPLGTIAEDAYEILLETIDPEDGLPRSEAHSQLLEADLADGDAEYAINRLLNCGYLYAVHDRLFVTDDDDFE